MVARIRPLHAIADRGGTRNVMRAAADTRGVCAKSKSTETETVWSFARVFDDASTQAAVFAATAAPLIGGILNGISAGIIAYGQTGSGKTHTMCGPRWSDAKAAARGGDASGEDDGLIPRTIGSLFERIDDQTREGSLEFDVRASFVELYNEVIADLLAPAGQVRKNVEIHGDRERNLFMTNSTEVPIVSRAQAESVFAGGAERRRTSATGMHAGSSRSHAIFILTVARLDLVRNETKYSQLYCVDLAGSESIKKTGAVGERLGEAKFINTSLLALANVIRRLSSEAQKGRVSSSAGAGATKAVTTSGKSERAADSGDEEQTKTQSKKKKKKKTKKTKKSSHRHAHVPYRDSKLTRLLQNCLGGSARTCIILALSPSEWNLAETMSTLRFGSSCQCITNRPETRTVVGISQLEEVLHGLNDAGRKQRSEIRRLEDEIGRWSELFSALDVATPLPPALDDVPLPPPPPPPLSRDDADSSGWSSHGRGASDEVAQDEVERWQRRAQVRALSDQVGRLFSSERSGRDSDERAAKAATRVFLARHAEQMRREQRRTQRQETLRDEANARAAAAAAAAGGGDAMRG